MNYISTLAHQLSLLDQQGQVKTFQEVHGWTIVREAISSRVVRLEMLLKLPRSHSKIKLLRDLCNFARQREVIEFDTAEASWLVAPAGKSETGRWRWNLYRRSRNY